MASVYPGPQRMTNPMNMPRPYRIYGHTLSYFTRKLIGHMSYKGLPWLQRTKTWPEHVLASPWPGGMPVVETPDDDALRFLCFAIEGFSDEWIYRCSVPTRWY